MLTTGQVPLEESALLVVDAQDSFRVRPRWARRSNPAFEANVAAAPRARRAAPNGHRHPDGACCETTAPLAADLGRAVAFVADATLTFPIAHLDAPGRELDVEAVVERTLYALRGRFARVVSTAALSGSSRR